MTKLLALDLGTVTGYAISPDDGVIASGIWNNKNSRFEGGGMRYLRFRGHLDEILKRLPLDQVVFEEVRRHRGTDAAHIYGGMLATLTAWCEGYGIPYEGIPIGTWKKFVCANGNAAKEDVLAAVRALGYDVSSFDQADAIGVCLFKLSELRRG